MNQKAEAGVPVVMAVAGALRPAVPARLTRLAPAALAAQAHQIPPVRLTLHSPGQAPKLIAQNTKEYGALARTRRRTVAAPAIWPAPSVQSRPPPG